MTATTLNPHSPLAAQSLAETVNPATVLLEAVSGWHGKNWAGSTHLGYDCVAYVGVFCWVVMVLFCLGGLWVTWYRYAGPYTDDASEYWREKGREVPGVSIVRPLKGIDPDMERNLSSTFQQDYPTFEIVFTAERADDPAIPVVQTLMEAFPEVKARVVVSSRKVGINPKINNIIDGVERTRYGILWMCDSNVWADPGCLARSVYRLVHNGGKPVGIVHHLILAKCPQSFGAWLETMFINTVHAKMYLAINATGAASCVVGKSNVYYKKQLEEVGGLESFSSYMAEDNTIAQFFWKRGWKHRMTADRAEQSLGVMTVRDYFVRRIRWTRTRKYNVTFATIVEPFTESILCGIFAAYSFHRLWQVPCLPFFLAHWVA
ncbi:Ceramide glucosyltransferase, partial [Dispira parvispora]